MSLIVRRTRPGKAIPPPGKPPGGSAPPPLPKDWEKKWKFYDDLDRMNPTMSLTAKEILSHTRKDEDEDDTADDDAKKRARVEAIKAANRAKRKGVGSKRNVSGTGTVSPILGSYPSGTVEEGGSGFSLSSIPSIVWIILAVAGGVFLIKSARKK